MIVLDSSALLAIVYGEPEAEAFTAVLAAEKDCILSTATGVECGVGILRRTGQAGRRRFEDLVHVASVRYVPVEQIHVSLALDAFTRYGKGMGHPAQLNFGDCFAYALAKALDAPLLYKGDDFAKTDVRSAL